MGPRRKSKLAGWNCDSMIGVGAVIQLSRMAALRSRSEKTPRALRALVFTGLRTMRPLSTPRTRASRRAPAGGPEASRPEDAEDDRGDERDPVRAGHVVHETREPGAERGAEPVAEVEDPIDRAEAAATEEVGRHRGDDRPAGTEAEAEEDRVDPEPRRARRRLERQQRERTARGAGERDGGRERTAEPVRREAQARAAEARHQPHQPEDRRGDERLDPEVDRERHLVGRDGEDREWREEAWEEEGPERARPQRVSQGGMGSGARGHPPAPPDHSPAAPPPPLRARTPRRALPAPPPAPAPPPPTAPR